MKNNKLSSVSLGISISLLYLIILSISYKSTMEYFPPNVDTIIALVMSGIFGGIISFLFYLYHKPSK